MSETNSPQTNGSQVSATAGLVSILIPCCGMLEYTKLCLPSLLRHTRAPYELIFLDIGSLDGTAEYLAGIKAIAPMRVEVVRTPTDLGIADACHEALGLALGEHIVLLNNDTIVTNAWLTQMLSLIAAPTIGMVGPMSNYAAPPQLVEEPVPYRAGARVKGGAQSAERIGALRASRSALHVDVSEVDAYAHDFRERHLGKWLQTERLGGFCLLIKRAVLKTIDSHERLADITDLGLFDTDILSAKARQYGFALGVCRDLFIHHFGTRTFAHGAPAGAA
jgi:O-antigen biosynthesis protein